VAITSPAALANVGTSFTVKAIVTDDVGVNRAEVLIDGQLSGTRNAAPFDFPLKAQPGPHVIKVVGYDAKNNRGEATLNLTVLGTATPNPTPNPSPDAPSAVPSAGTGKYGDPCGAPTHCKSGLCAADPSTGQKFCTQGCSIASPCPIDSECLGTSIGTEVCAPAAAPSSSGPALSSGDRVASMSCSVSSASADGLLSILPLLALAGLALARRRGVSRSR